MVYCVNELLTLIELACKSCVVEIQVNDFIELLAVNVKVNPIQMHV